MSDVYIGKGKLAEKGVYAARDFREGEVVKFYHLKQLTQSEFDELPESERMFTHSFWGKIYLFPEPSRYTNHSAKPNTRADLERMCDVALRPIKKGEMITTNATQEILSELRTFVESYESKKKVTQFERLKGGYRNAVVRYSLSSGKRMTLILQRVAGNWQVMNK